MSSESNDEVNLNDLGRKIHNIEGRLEKIEELLDPKPLDKNILDSETNALINNLKKEIETLKEQVQHLEEGSFMKFENIDIEGELGEITKKEVREIQRTTELKALYSMELIDDDYRD